MNAPFTDDTSSLRDGISHKRRLRDGICESKSSTLHDADDSSLDPSIATLAKAVAQMVFADGDGIRRDPDTESLHIPYWRLEQLDIGGHPLCPGTKSDFGKFMSQACIRASTATLIGPRHVLTTAHSVIMSNIVSHHFLFNRHSGALYARNDGEKQEFVIANGHYSTARKLLAYVRTPLVDWAVLELYEDVTDVEPLGIGRWRPQARAEFLGYPLGLPLKYAEVKPIETEPSPHPPAHRIAFDNGGGGSGSPIIQSGAVVGVVRGRAGTSPKMLSSHDGKACIDPSLANCACAQPFTPASHFAPCLPDIMGW